VCEEVIRPDFLAKHDVVVHVDEALRQARDSMQVALYGWRGECWKVALVAEYLLAK